MSVSSLIKGLFSRPPEQGEVDGMIVDGPWLLKGSDEENPILVFRLDSNPDWEFRHAVSPLSLRHRMGDRVRVHYQRVTNGVMNVEWMQSIDADRIG